MKFNEELIGNEVKKYIETTYSQHYANDGIQVNDLIVSIGHGEGAFVSNAIEYLARYGKKDGKNLKDLYKAIHNIFLLINMNHIEEIEEINRANSINKPRVIQDDLALIEKNFQLEIEFNDI